MSLWDICRAVANTADIDNKDNDSKKLRTPSQALAVARNLLTSLRSGRNDSVIPTEAGGTASDSRSNTTTTNINPQDLPANTVFLNVYDITDMNGVLYHAGIGAHHTGVEVYGLEVAFGRCDVGSGVFETTPKQTAPHIFREQLILGLTPFSLEEVRKLIQEFKDNEDQWSGRSYHLLRHNCNNFTQVFAKRLLPPKVRAEQQQQGHCVEVYDCGEREEERLPNGEVVMLPVVMPRWVNRLARNISWFVSEELLDRMGILDRESGELPKQG